MIVQHSIRPITRQFIRRCAAVALLGAGLLLAACSSSADTEPATAPALAVTEAATATPLPPTAEPPAATAEPAAEPAAQAGDAEGPRLAQFVIVPEESEARYSINEVFISDNNTLATAIGATSQVQGGMTLNYDDPAASEFDPFVVDISTLRSDRSQRDRAIRRQWLESSTYPLAVFDVREVRNFPADPQEGEPIAFQLAGDMTVKETTQEVVWEVTATLEGDRLSGTATLATTLESFNIPVPSIANILRVTDGITLTLDFVMARAAE